MAFPKLTYEKTWEDPAAFPTYQDSEQQVRADLQYHPDAILRYINETLLPALAAETAAAGLGDARTGKIQTTIEELYELIATLRSDLEQAVLDKILPEGTVLTAEDIRAICV